MRKILESLRRANIIPYLIVFYLVGVAGLIIPATHDLFRMLVPVTLFLSFLLLLLYHGPGKRSFVAGVFFLFLAGLFVEILGVKTGLIFGEYEYGPTLGPKLFHTPLIIGINWFMLVYCSLVIVTPFTENRYFRAIIAAILMVVYDFALEPAAIWLEMWDWGGDVPIQNYLAWFVIAFLFAIFSDRIMLINKKNSLAKALFFIQLLFFILLDIWIFIINDTKLFPV